MRRLVDRTGLPYPSAPVEQRATTAYAGRVGGGIGGSLTSGGIRNPASGMGTRLDKSEASFFIPTHFYWRGPLEVVGVQSWAARNFIDIPVDDMFIRWRVFTDAGASEATVEQMMAAEERHRVKKKLSRALKAARQYGTGCVIMITREAALDTPLVPEQIRRGDLVNLLVLDRYDMSVMERDLNILSPTYGEPVRYAVHPSRGGTAVVHSSRVLRFDGIEPNTDSGFTIYEQDWGVSELVPVILSILEDQGVATNIAHLSHEASVPVLSVSSLRDALSGAMHPSEVTPEDIGQQINQLKSNFRLLMLDKETEEFTRVAVAFGGLSDLLDAFQSRLAAAARIPETRWRGRSPAGLNATGDSDMRNYVMMMEANRTDKLGPALIGRLDAVLARDAGAGEPPEFEWMSLLDLSEEDQAKVSGLRVKAATEAVTGGLVDEDEGREAISGDSLFGVLEGPAPEVEEPEVEEPEPDAPRGEPF